MAPTQLPDIIIESHDDTKIKQIPPYSVILLNDDITTMEFVIHILITVFKKDTVRATELMLAIHQTGSAVVDVLSLEEAELRQQQTHSLARQAGYPLRCIIEPA